MDCFASGNASARQHTTDDADLPLDEALFLERLKFFYEQSLNEIRAFARREGRSYEDIKRHVAQLHCQSLFGSGSSGSKETQTDILKSISLQLESLQSISGLQSFYLAVIPGDPSDPGFLGGTLLGREFWRGHRGCGEPGARAFKEFCQNASTPRAALVSAPQASSSRAATGGTPAMPPAQMTSIQPAGGTSLKKTPASTVKAEVYLAVRNAVRTSSGQRNAEMKWSNHSNLGTYGIELVGWPPGVPMRNPSVLSVAQNQAILDAFKNGTMWFRRLGQMETAALNTPDQQEEENDDALFEDTIDFTGASGDAIARTDAESRKRKREGSPDV